MSSTLAPFGLMPVYHPSGLSRAQGLKVSIDETVTQSFFKYGAVQLGTAGLIVPMADAAWDAAADDLYGVFAGVEYTDSAGQRKVRNSWVGPITGATDVYAWVWTDPLIVYEAQASAAVPKTGLGAQANFTALDTGNTTTGISNLTLDATLVAAASQGHVRIVGVSPRVDNDWNDTYTILHVQIAAHVFVANKVGI